MQLIYKLNTRIIVWALRARHNFQFYLIKKLLFCIYELNGVVRKEQTDCFMQRLQREIST